MNKKTDRFSRGGFTLAELLVAMVITGIILGSAVGMAYAMGNANDSSDDARLKQAQVRYATLRICDLIRQCKLVCSSHSSDIAVWRADDNRDGKMNAGEVVYLDKGEGSNYLRINEISSPSILGLQIGQIAAVTTPWWVAMNGSMESTMLIPQCSNVQFILDAAAPYTKCVTILFDMTEEGVVRHYQISETLRCWAGNMLNGGNIVSSDDD